MKDIDQLTETEKKIGGSVWKTLSDSAKPPFAVIAGRIEAGQSAESFEEFFAGDIPSGQIADVGNSLRAYRPAPGNSAGHSRNLRPLKIAAGAAAAVLVVLAGGGVMLAAVLNGTSLGSKTSADSAEHSAYMDYDLYENGSLENNKSAEMHEEADEEYVSDSDMNDSDDTESSGFSD